MSIYECVDVSVDCRGYSKKNISMKLAPFSMDGTGLLIEHAIAGASLGRVQLWSLKK